jgi:hypothetical protein
MRPFVEAPQMKNVAANSQKLRLPLAIVRPRKAVVIGLPRGSAGGSSSVAP